MFVRNFGSSLPGNEVSYSRFLPNFKEMYIRNLPQTLGGEGFIEKPETLDKSRELFVSLLF